MSKKKKAAEKANNKGRKADKLKKKDNKSVKNAAAKTSKESKQGSKKPAKTLKKALVKVAKSIAKKVLAPKKSSAKTSSSKPAANKKPQSKKTAKPVNKVVAKKAIKAKPVSEKPAASSKLKPAVSVPAKSGGKSPAVNAAVKGKAVSNSANKEATKKPAATAGKKTAPSDNHKQNGSDKSGRKLNDLFEKKPAARKDEVLAITNTIPVKTESEISPSKIASISYSITNPVRRTDSYAVKADKEPPGKFEMEFVVHASAEMLYEFLSTASGLSEWFCDDLNIRNGIYTFIWDDQLQQARLLKTVDQQLVRFQWVDKTDGSYFEFRIQRDDLTNDVSLIITDFAENAAERESAKLLWNSQVEKLMHVIGSIF